MKDKSLRKLFRVLVKKLGAGEVEYDNGLFGTKIDWIYDSFNLPNKHELKETKTLIFLLAEKLGYEFKESIGITCEKKKV